MIFKKENLTLKQQQYPQKNTIQWITDFFNQTTVNCFDTSELHENINSNLPLSEIQKERKELSLLLQKSTSTSDIIYYLQEYDKCVDKELSYHLNENAHSISNTTRKQSGSLKESDVIIAQTPNSVSKKMPTKKSRTSNRTRQMANYIFDFITALTQYRQSLRIISIQHTSYPFNESTLSFILSQIISPNQQNNSATNRIPQAITNELLSDSLSSSKIKLTTPLSDYHKFHITSRTIKTIAGTIIGMVAGFLVGMIIGGVYGAVIGSAIGAMIGSRTNDAQKVLNSTQNKVSLLSNSLFSVSNKNDTVNSTRLLTVS